MVLEPDGLYSVYVGSSAIGQGLETAFAQIAADALEVPMVQERLGDVLHLFAAVATRADVEHGKPHRMPKSHPARWATRRMRVRNRSLRRWW